MLTTNADERPSWISKARRPPPFVGREHELAQLSAVLRGSRNGRAWLVLVSGERGLGKTRLAAELAERAARDGARVLFGRCRPGRRLAPDWSWTRSLVDFGDEAARQSLFLGSAMSVAAARRPPRSVATHDGRGGFGRADVVAQIRAEIRKAPPGQPLLVVLDDLHNADAPTVTALARLMRELKCAPLLIVGLYRSAEMRPSPRLGGLITRLESEGVHLALPPLSEEETAVLTEAIAARRLEPQVVTGIYRATGGNPLLTHAVVGLLNRESAQQPLELHAASARDRAGRALMAIEARPLLPSVGYLLDVHNTIGTDELDRSAIGSKRGPLAKFCRKGDYWMLSYGDEYSLVRDRKGLRYVAYLLRYPQKEIHVLDLVSFIATRKACLPLLEREDLPANYDPSVDGARARGLGDAGELLDQQAKCAYKQRLMELAEELRQVKKDGDEQRAVKLEDEIAAIERELRRAFGPDGRARVAAAVAEKARVNVRAPSGWPSIKSPDRVRSWRGTSTAPSGPDTSARIGPIRI